MGVKSKLLFIFYSHKPFASRIDGSSYIVPPDAMLSC
jgi:hypothetical protein